MEDRLCYYCGQSASGVDHVIPSSVLKNMGVMGDRKVIDEITRGRILTVDCCLECNSRLGASVQETLGERKRHLKSLLRIKYKKVLAMPDWTESELEGMGEHLMGIIRAALLHKKIIKERLAW